MGCEYSPINGLDESMIEEVQAEANPSGQSTLFLSDKLAIIARIPDEKLTGLPACDEIQRRVAATRLHSSKLAEYTQADFALLEGNGQSPVLARIMPKYEDVKRLDEVPVAQIVRDKELRKAITEIYAAYYHFLKAGIAYDVGLNPNGSYTNLLRQSLFSRNIFIGDEGIVFCDPDWYENLDPDSSLRRKIFFHSLFGLRAGAFKLLTLFR